MLALVFTTTPAGWCTAGYGAVQLHQCRHLQRPGQGLVSIHATAQALLISKKSRPATQSTPISRYREAATFLTVRQLEGLVCRTGVPRSSCPHGRQAEQMIHANMIRHNIVMPCLASKVSNGVVCHSNPWWFIPVPCHAVTGSSRATGNSCFFRYTPPIRVLTTFLGCCLLLLCCCQISPAAAS
jgi:hypothetical protein